MISRRAALTGLASLTVPVAGCSGRHTASAPSHSAPYSSSYSPPPPEPTLPGVTGLDAVIDMSHMVAVGDFVSIRQSGILAVVHKASEGGDWFDPSYGVRRSQAQAAGLLWGAYHFGTRQYSGAQQAAAFLSAVRPGPTTLMALDFEPNDYNPRNTMTLAQAEAFVQTVYQSTGRLPLIYTHPSWADGQRHGRAGLRLSAPISPHSLLARCELWLADYREQPELPYAWADRGWRLWQYAGDQTAADIAYGAAPRAVPGVSHCDRNLFAGDAPALYRFWTGRPGMA